MIPTAQAIAIVAVTALMTQFTRWLPFLVFGTKRETPKVVLYLGRGLPAAIIATLVIYCLKSVSPSDWLGSLCQLLAVAAVALLHIWKRQTLLSIAGGTILYMVLIRVLGVI